MVEHREHIEVVTEHLRAQKTDWRCAIGDSFSELQDCYVAAHAAQEDHFMELFGRMEMCLDESDWKITELETLGTSSGVPGQDTARTSQENEQCTHQKPVWYTTITFSIFQASLIAVFPTQKMPSTSRVFPVM